ncbi:MAG: glycosyl hydrolase family 28-related protein [Rhizomicrobium sp.]
MNRRKLLATAAAATGAVLLGGVPTLVFAATHKRRPGIHAKPVHPGVGADIPWTTYPSEDMKTTGTVLHPKYGPFLVEMESSNQTCVKLTAAGEYVEFKVRSAANAMVVRYSLPDSPDGDGINSTLDLYRNGSLLRQVPVTSKYAWLYGDYPFTNDPKAGKPRNFYDEVRLKGLKLRKGDVIRLQKADDGAAYCIIDLVDLENIAPPLRRPANSLSVSDFGADGKGQTDDTQAVRNCIAQAALRGKIAWVPAGEYKLTGDVVLPSEVTLQGAGMWHTTFIGDDELYVHPDRRLRFKLTGSNSHFADFALIGKLKYRNDSEQNDGIFGAHAKNGSVSRVWVEHTKVGMWFYVCSNVVVDGCRLRNTVADGINLCVDVRDTIVQNCTTRNTGDDCFAIWPAASDQSFEQEAPLPGNNIFHHCTGQLPFLAQGGAIYGGANNRIEDCLFTDIGSGCGILLSTTFPTSDDSLKIDNNFSGTTIVRNCDLLRCGGYDQGWTWRAALQICMHRQSISGLKISGVRIKDGLSDGFAVIVPPDTQGQRMLSDTRLENVDVSNYGIGTPGRHGLWVSKNASGSLTIANSKIVDVENDSADFIITTN